MTVLGLDYSYAWRSINLDEVKRLGYSFVIRYLTWPIGNAINKKLQAAEAADIRARDLQLGVVWEYKAGDELAGSVGGKADAQEAVRQARELRYPEGCSILFATDFDVVSANQATVDAYFTAAGAVVHSAGYLIGQYGGYWEVKHSFDHGLIDTAAQTYAWSWDSVNKVRLWDPRAQIRQVKNGQTIAGGATDINEMHGDARLWCSC